MAGQLKGASNLTISRALFKKGLDFSPIIFFSDNISDELKHIINKGGGVLTDNPQDATVLLCEKKTDNRINKGYLPIDFIVDCVKRNTFLDIEKYRQDSLGLQASTSKECTEVLESDSNDEEGNAIKFTESSRIRVKKSDMAGRKKYSDYDDLKIIKHLINHDLYSLSGGNAVWKMMESVKVTDHTYQSMKARFHKIIIPNIDSYDIPPQWKAKLTGVETEESEDIEEPSFSDISDWKSQLQRLKPKKNLLKVTASDDQEIKGQNGSNGSITKSPRKRNQVDESEESDVADSYALLIEKPKQMCKSKKIKLQSLHSTFTENSPKKRKTARVESEINFGTSHSDDAENVTNSCEVAACDNLQGLRGDVVTNKNTSSPVKESVNKCFLSNGVVESEVETSYCRSPHVHEPDDPTESKDEIDEPTLTGFNSSTLNGTLENISFDIESDQMSDLGEDLESEDEIDKEINKFVVARKQNGSLTTNSVSRKEFKAHLFSRTESSNTGDVHEKMGKSAKSVSDSERLSPEIEFVAESLQGYAEQIKTIEGTTRHHPDELLLDIEYLTQRFGLNESDAAYLLKVHSCDIVATLQFLQS